MRLPSLRGLAESSARERIAVPSAPRIGRALCALRLRCSRTVDFVGTVTSHVSLARATAPYSLQSLPLKGSHTVIRPKGGPITHRRRNLPSARRHSSDLDEEGAFREGLQRDALL